MVFLPEKQCRIAGTRSGELFAHEGGNSFRYIKLLDIVPINVFTQNKFYS